MTNWTIKQKAISLWVIFLLLMNSCHQEQEKAVLTIAAAANTQFVLETLTDHFTETHAIRCELIISSSGKLTAQLKAGAPYDVFISADQKYPQSLYDAGLCKTPPQTYAIGKLALWSMKKDYPLSLDSLTDPQIKHIAIANPQTAPYGQAAMELLQEKGVYEQVMGKLVYGESIAQTNQFITSQNADMGITAAAVVHAPMMKHKGHWRILDTDLHQPIQQGVVIMGKSRHQDIAQQFVHFIFSEKGKAILEQYGYETLPRSTAYNHNDTD